MRRDVQFECHRTQFVPGSAVSALHVGNVDRTMMRVIGEFLDLPDLKNVVPAIGRAGINAAESVLLSLCGQSNRLDSGRANGLLSHAHEAFRKS